MKFEFPRRQNSSDFPSLSLCPFSTQYAYIIFDCIYAPIANMETGSTSIYYRRHHPHPISNFLKAVSVFHFRSDDKNGTDRWILGKWSWKSKRPSVYRFRICLFYFLCRFFFLKRVEYDGDCLCQTLIRTVRSANEYIYFWKWWKNVELNKCKYKLSA